MGGSEVHKSTRERKEAKEPKTRGSEDGRETKRQKKTKQLNEKSTHWSRSRKKAECNELALSLPLSNSAKMSDEDENSGSIAEEQALHLKTLAEQKYNSGDPKSALKYAKRAHKLHPSLHGLQEMLTSFKILQTASMPVFESSPSTQNSTPDYYKILQVERFSHINTIKKQYKKLALTLHPDKNPFVASEEAFKLVGEAARMLSDKIRRKEYDMKLRIAMQSEAVEEVELGADTFWTACSACRLLHQFERKYLGHNLMCPRCKKSFKAMEVEKDRKNEEKNDGVEEGQTRVSARIRERTAKGGKSGIVEKSGLGVKRKSNSVGKVLEKSGVKMAREMDEDGVLLKDLMPKRVEKVEKLEEHELRESERTKRAKAREEETMTLSQMQMLAKKKKLVDGKMTMKVKEVDSEKLKAKEKEGEKEKEKDIEDTNVKEMVNLKEKTYRRRSKNITLESGHLEIERDKAPEKGNMEVLLVEKEKENGKEKEKEIEDTREKRQRRRVSKYGNMEILEVGKNKTHKNQVDLGMERLITTKKGSLEIMPVEDSDFHDFDKDRRERTFKKRQVWAVYDDNDGMPRHYALIEEIVSINPFEVTLSWFEFQSNGDEEFINWQKKGFHISCGSFRVSRKVSIKYLNLFSHVVDCERAAREIYRIYPKKGSVWALYRNNAEERNQTAKDKRSYDIVVILSSYCDLYGLSIAHLEKVDGFRTVFKRRGIGANAVLCLDKSDVKLFSHQIPAKKLSGEEASGLPKECWELDPASLAPQLLIGS